MLTPPPEPPKKVTSIGERKWHPTAGTRLLMAGWTLLSSSSCEAPSDRKGLHAAPRVDATVAEDMRVQASFPDALNALNAPDARSRDAAAEPDGVLEPDARPDARTDAEAPAAPDARTDAQAPDETPLLISEVMADNEDTLRDGDGDSPDWVELYNPGPGPVALGGWRLSDGDGTLVFGDADLAPGEFLIVFASGKRVRRCVCSAPTAAWRTPSRSRCSDPTRASGALRR